MLFVAGCPIIDDLNERQGAMYFNQRAPNIFSPRGLLSLENSRLIHLKVFETHLNQTLMTLSSKCYPPGNDHMSHQKSLLESMIFLFPFGGMCDGSLEGNFHRCSTTGVSP